MDLAEISRVSDPIDGPVMGIIQEGSFESINMPHPALRTFYLKQKGGASSQIVNFFFGKGAWNDGHGNGKASLSNHRHQGSGAISACSCP